jgi:hypothetical protein
LGDLKFSASASRPKYAGSTTPKIDAQNRVRLLTDDIIILKIRGDDSQRRADLECDFPPVAAGWPERAALRTS